MKKIVALLTSLLLLFFSITSTAYADENAIAREYPESPKIDFPSDYIFPQAPGDMSQEDYINAGGQGIDIPLDPTELEHEWYSNLPSYHGDIIKNNMIKKLSSKDIKLNSKDIYVTYNLVFKQIQNLLANSADTKFKYWRDCALSEPISVYDAVDDIYAYMFGLIDENMKIVGYIVAGATTKTPPILEFSTNPVKFMAMKEKASDKIYFDPKANYLYKNVKNELKDLSTDNEGILPQKVTILNET